MHCCRLFQSRAFRPLLLLAAFLILGGTLLLGRWLQADPVELKFDDPPTVKLPAGGSVTFHLPKMPQDALFSVLVTLDRPGQLALTDAVSVAIRSKQTALADMVLHQLDGDSYVLCRAPTVGRPTIELRSHAGKEVKATVRVHPWSIKANDTVQLEHEPNDTWQQANAITLDSVVFGSCDDRNLYPPHRDPRPVPAVKLTHYGQPIPDEEAKALAHGEDWFTFELKGDRPRLTYFVLDVIDREVPLDVTVWQVKDDKLVSYVNGIDPTSDLNLDTPAIDPHEVQTRLANKFTTRVLQPGRYYLRVEGNHPAYQLRTFTYDVPRFDNVNDLGPQARKAVRAGMDYIVNAGDSWHANIPRMGAVQNRLTGVHSETAWCVACHPTHFSMRAHQVAVGNGYPVKQRPAVQFLADRLYNNPRPFYGHEQEATWGRMISASANVMSRMGYINTLYERNTDSPPRPGYLEGIAGYLDLYYRGRDKLPNNETNGNLPVVSAYEVVGHSWFVFETLHNRPRAVQPLYYGPPAYDPLQVPVWEPPDRVRSTADGLRGRLRKLNEEDTFTGRKDDAKRPVLLDLCWQTANFCSIDRKGYAERIQKNCEAILKLQRPDGQWSMLTDPKSQPVKFQTGHCLWVLGLAGYTPEHPQIRKGVEALLRSQQTWGGWFDSSPYENFKTPFRETQYAIMALSQLFPSESPGRKLDEARGWRAGWPELELRAEPNEVKLLAQLDQVWGKFPVEFGGEPRTRQVTELKAALKHPEPLVRQVAAEAAARARNPRLIAGLSELLGDPSKLVRHSAGWALRQYLDVPAARDTLRRAQSSDNDLQRRGAARVVNQHFAHAQGPPGSVYFFSMPSFLGERDPLVQLLAVRARWQWFWWTRSTETRRGIVSNLLAGLAEDGHLRVRSQHPHVTRALREALYNVADENTRYLYNNWIPSLARQEDRDKAVAAQKRQMKMIGEVVAQALTIERPGIDDWRTEYVLNVLTALAEFHLRRGGYKNAKRYGRIGNDVEQIFFYADSQPLLEPLLVKLLNHANPRIREQAAVVSLTLKGTPVKQLPLALFALQGDREPTVRAAATEVQPTFPLAQGGKTDEAVAKHVTEMLASPQPETQAAALNVVARLGGKLTSDEGVIKAVRGIVTSKDPGPDGPRLARLPAALQALPRFPMLHAEQPVKDALARALQAEETSVRRSALDVTLSTPAFTREVKLYQLANDLLRSDDAENRQLVLELARTRSELASRLDVVSSISEALGAKEDAVRREALALVQKNPALAKNPAVRLALKTLLDDPSERTRQLAEQLYDGKTVEVGDVTKLLDFEYFRQKVEPLFAVKGGDGQACALCHHTHTIFRLSRPDATGGFTLAQSKEHYRAALKVIDLTKPGESLLLRKPLADARTEGVLDQKALSHGGGVRWNGTEDPAYRTLLAWINGARLK